MAKLEKRACPCCGAPLENYKNKCDYCGGIVKDDTIQYIGIRPGMRKVRACARVPECLLESATGKQAAANHVIRDVTLKLAEGLSDIVTWKMDRDIRTSEIIVNGELWVSEPDVRLIGNWPF